MPALLSGYEFQLAPIGNLDPVLPDEHEKSSRVEIATGGPLQIVYGNERANIFNGSSNAREPVVFVGGEKGDIYRITPGLLSIVADLAEEPEPEDDDKPDTLDLTAIDRAKGLWGYLRIGNDYLMTEIVSGMATLIHDPFGMQGAGNTIEQVRVQYRDPATGLVDASRSQVMSFSNWINGGPETLGPMADLGKILGIAPSFSGLINDGVVANYDAYNTILGIFRQLGSNLVSTLVDILSDANDPVAPDLANVIMSLPLTSEIGLPTDQAVQNAWFNAAHNVDVLG